MLTKILISKITVTNRLRKLNPKAVAAFAEEAASGSALPPVEVVKSGDAWRLVTGAHRLAAARQAGADDIDAIVLDLTDENDLTLREIRENVIRYELTILDRAVHLNRWRQIYEATMPLPKRGPKPKDNSPPQTLRTIDGEERLSPFVARFSAAAAEFLGISERSVQMAVHMAQHIAPGVQDTIALLPVADNQSDLMLIAGQTPPRQQKIADALAAGEGRSVADIIAAMDGVTEPKPAAWERLSSSFSRLKPEERDSFFEAHAAEISEWVTSRTIRKAA